MIKKDKKIKKVTIDDLARMIKEDVIDHMATKDDLKGMATKDDLKKVEDVLIHRIDGLEGRIGGLERRIYDYALNKVGYDSFNQLVKRVEALEKA